MIVIPAIDLKGGKCVRLLQGRMDQETVFSDNPEAMAVRWTELGAELLHVVDLDGAVEKTPRNLLQIQGILRAVDIPIQVGGGIRDEDTIRMYMDLGVHRVVIGTEAIRNPRLLENASQMFPGRIVLAIDSRNGRVAIEGWTETTRTSAVDLAKRFESCPLAAINFTDIHRDGMQTGPNIEETRRLAEAVTLPVVASGGVSRLKDIENLLPLAGCGVVGVITGKAIYAGTLDFKEAVSMTKKVIFPGTPPQAVYKN